MRAGTGHEQCGSKREVVAGEPGRADSLECVSDVVFQGIPQSNKAGHEAPPVSIFSTRCMNLVCTVWPASSLESKTQRHQAYTRNCSRDT
jgi:hypothetical protein